jgi:hypothetical protein
MITTPARNGSRVHHPRPLSQPPLSSGYAERRAEAERTLIALWLEVDSDALDALSLPGMDCWVAHPAASLHLITGPARRCAAYAILKQRRQGRFIFELGDDRRGVDNARAALEALSSAAAKREILAARAVRVNAYAAMRARAWIDLVDWAGQRGEQPPLPPVSFLLECDNPANLPSWSLPFRHLGDHI